MTLKQLQSRTEDWIQTYGVRYFGELTNMAILTEEVGELSRLLAREYGEQSYKRGLGPTDIKAAIGEELADIIFVITCLSNQMGIDLESAMEEGFAKRTKRDETRHINNDKL